MNTPADHAKISMIRKNRVLKSCRSPVEAITQRR
jgi:hypothetical protein